MLYVIGIWWIYSYSFSENWRYSGEVKRKKWLQCKYHKYLFLTHCRQARCNFAKKIMWSHLIQNVEELHKSDRKHVCQLLIMLLYRNWLLTFHLLTIKMVHNVLVLHKRQKCITWHRFSDLSSFVFIIHIRK